MLSLRQLICFLLSLLSFISTFYSVSKLAYFLATPSSSDERASATANADERLRLKQTLFALLFNSVWAVLFVVQHSGMRSSLVKKLWETIGLELAERSLYNIASSYMLLVLLKNWQSVPHYQLWYVDVEQHRAFWWVMVAAHVLSWVIIYGGSLMVDLPELIGLKQVYYDINDLAPPLSYKSRDLQQYYNRLRHPSFVGLSTVLWFTNAMSPDRLLLASLWTVYMYLFWSTTSKELQYQRHQLERKRIELSGVNE